MKITTKKFVITTEAKNSNGFRVRTSGIELADYNNNPILLWMHQRPKGERKDEVLPLGNVVDIELVDNKYLGRLAFDESDPFAMSLYEKAENGTLRMLSPGLIPLTWKKDNAGDMWLETSRIKEISLCDIGSNAEALAVALYDTNDNKINLSLKDINTFLKPDNTMKLLQLSALAVLPLLKLKDDATPEEAQAAIGELVTLVDTQAASIVTLTEKATNLQTALDASVKLANEAKITALLDDAELKLKFLKGDRKVWQELAEKNFDGTKAALDSMPGSKSVMEQLANQGAGDSELLALSYEELDKANKLVKLKAENLPAFKEKYKAKFGKDYIEN